MTKVTSLRRTMKMKYKVKTQLTTMVLLTLMAFGSVQASDAVSEKDNFYQAVNGKMLAVQKIRPTEASWSWFSERSLDNKKALGKELETVAAKQGTYAKGTAEQKSPTSMPVLSTISSATLRPGLICRN